MTWVIHQSVCLTINLSASSIDLSINLSSYCGSVCLSVYAFACLSVCLSVCRRMPVGLSTLNLHLLLPMPFLISLWLGASSLWLLPALRLPHMGVSGSEGCKDAKVPQPVLFCPVRRYTGTNASHMQQV